MKSLKPWKLTRVKFQVEFQNILLEGRQCSYAAIVMGARVPFKRPPGNWMPELDNDCDWGLILAAIISFKKWNIGQLWKGSSSLERISSTAYANLTSCSNLLNCCSAHLFYSFDLSFCFNITQTSISFRIKHSKNQNIKTALQTGSPTYTKSWFWNKTNQKNSGNLEPSLIKTRPSINFWEHSSEAFIVFFPWSERIGWYVLQSHSSHLTWFTLFS